MARPLRPILTTPGHRAKRVKRHFFSGGSGGLAMPEVTCPEAITTCQRSQGYRRRVEGHVVVMSLTQKAATHQPRGGEAKLDYRSMVKQRLAIRRLPATGEKATWSSVIGRLQPVGLLRLTVLVFHLP